MKNILTFFFFLCFVIACTNNEKPKTTPPAKSSSKPQTTAKVGGLNAAKIYKLNCVSCHGPDGDMAFNGASNLVTSTLSKEETIQVITKGRKTMMAYGNILGKEKIEAVTDYIMQLRK